MSKAPSLASSFTMPEVTMAIRANVSGCAIGGTGSPTRDAMRDTSASAKAAVETVAAAPAVRVLVEITVMGPSRSGPECARRAGWRFATGPWGHVVRAGTRS